MSKELVRGVNKKEHRYKFVFGVETPRTAGRQKEKKKEDSGRRVMSGCGSSVEGVQWTYVLPSVTATCNALHPT